MHAVKYVHQAYRVKIPTSIHLHPYHVTAIRQLYRLLVGKCKIKLFLFLHVITTHIYPPPNRKKKNYFPNNNTSNNPQNTHTQNRIRTPPPPQLNKIYFNKSELAGLPTVIRVLLTLQEFRVNKHTKMYTTALICFVKFKATHPTRKYNHHMRIFQFCKMFFTIKLPTLVNLIS